MKIGVKKFWLLAYFLKTWASKIPSSMICISSYISDVCVTIRRPPTSLRPPKEGLPNFSVRLISWNTETYILYSHNNAAILSAFPGMPLELNCRKLRNYAGGLPVRGNL